MNNEQAQWSEGADEISIYDILDFFVEGWKTILVAVVAALALASAFLVITPKRYEATAIIEMGRIANITLEAPAILLEKIKLLNYFNKETKLACGANDQNFLSFNVASVIIATINKSAPLINLSYKTSNPDAATSCLSAVIADIQKSQETFFDASLKPKQIYLQLLNSRLSKIESDKEKINEKAMKFDISDSKFSASALLYSTLLTQDNLKRAIQKEVLELENNLSPPLTQPTTIVADIYTPSSPVEPKKTIILAASIAAGLFLGILFLLGKKFWVGFRAHRAGRV